MSQTIADLLRIRPAISASLQASPTSPPLSPKPSTPCNFLSLNPPARMGNSLDIAFGGCTLGLSISAVCSTISGGMELYSCLGYYMGPTLTTCPLSLEVERVRDTRSFSTRKVVARQADNGNRVCFYMIADFSAPEQGVMAYAPAPRMQYLPPSSLRPYSEVLDSAVRDGNVSAALVQEYRRVFPLLEKFFDFRGCPEGVGTQNLLGLDKAVETTQEDLPIREKTSAYWIKSRTPLSKDESMAALGFVLDAALAFLPLTFSHSFLDDFGAVSTLDFALHFHEAADMNKWILVEQTTELAAGGKTWSGSHVWNEDGRCLATMRQTSILRAKATKLKL